MNNPADMSIETAIEIAGSQSELARRLGITLQRLSNWRSRGIPFDQVIRVAQAVDFQVTPHQLNPDLYPNPTDGVPPDQQSAA